MAAFAGLGLLLGLARWGLEPSHASGDSFWYARLALEARGKTDADATQLAANFIVHEGRGTDPGVYVDLVRTIDPRYPAIFASRPVYPLIVAGLLQFADIDVAMALGALLAGAAFAVLFGGFIWRVTGSLAAAGGGVALAFILPSGKWFAFMYADGWLFTFMVLTLALATNYLRFSRRVDLIGVGAAIGLAYLTKPANGVALVVALVVLGMAASVSRHPQRGAAVRLGAAAALIGVVQLACFAVLGLPGFATTLQDMFTLHFTFPDVSEPLPRLFARDAEVVPWLLAFPIREPLLAFVGAGLLVPLLRWNDLSCGLGLVVGLVSLPVVLVHPVTSEVPRLLAPIWISASLGGGLLIGRIFAVRSATRLHKVRYRPDQAAS
jgi:4-amino-4-deoxy-L-arabinose transferase-like glycosyltransferase